MKTILHYIGYDCDQGGILTVIRNLAAMGRFRCVLGVNAGFEQSREPALEVLALPPIAGERINLLTGWRARAVARATQTWLRAGPDRVFHGHSRAGLLVALWLRVMGESQVVVSVHCYGRQRWFYRWAARWLGGKLYWLSPAMRRYYGVGAADWSQCMAEGVLPTGAASRPVASDILRVGGVGQIVRWKGWHLVLEALAALPPAIRSRLEFEHIGPVGTGKDARRYAAELTALTERLGLTQQVRWRGTEPSSSRLLTEVELLVIPSDHEPFSVALLEALAAGVPVLAADSGGAVDVVLPDQNGWLFRSGQAVSLAARLEEWVLNPTKRCLDQATVQRSSRYVTEIAPQWAEVYARL